MMNKRSEMEQQEKKRKCFFYSIQPGMMINYLPNLSGPLPAAFFFASKNEKKMSVE